MAIRHSATDSDAGPAPPNAQEADQLDPLCSVNRPHRFGGRSTAFWNQPGSSLPPPDVRNWDGTAGQNGESRFMREWRTPVETSHSYQSSVAKTIHLAEKAGTSGVGRNLPFAFASPSGRCKEF